MANRESLSLMLSLDGIASVQAGIQQVINSIGKLNSTVVTVASLAGITASVAGVGALTKGTIELGQNLNDLKQRVGATIPQLWAMQRLLAENGGSAQNVAFLMDRMATSIIEAAEKGGELEAVFKEMNLDVVKLASLSPGEQFMQIAKGIAAITNEDKKTQALRSIFGRTGAELKGAFSDIAQVQAAFNNENDSFVAAMTRTAALFDVVDVAMQRFALNGVKVMTGFMDQVLPGIIDGIQKLGDIDLTPFGARIGAFFAVVIQSVKDDKFPEMIGLLIEAGFEIGAMAARRVMSSVNEFIGSNFVATLSATVANAIMTFGVRFTEMILNLMGPIAWIVGSITEYLGSRLRYTFQTFWQWLKDEFALVVNVWATLLEALVNKVIEGFNKVSKMFGGSGASPVSFGRIQGGMGPDIAKPETWEQALKNNAATSHEIVNSISGYLDDQLKKSRQLLLIAGGITGQDNVRLDALKRLNALIDAQIAKRAAGAQAEKTAQASGDEVRRYVEMRALQEAELQLKEQLGQKDAELQRVESDWTATANEKYAEKKKLLQDQKDILDKIVANLQRQAQLDPAREDQLKEKALGFQKQSDMMGNKADNLGPDPNSFGQQFTAVRVKLQNEMGTMAQSMAKTFETVFNSAIQSISKGITGLIMGTMTWKQALFSIANTIMSTVVESIVQMGVRWVMTQIMMAVAGKAIAASATAASAPIAAALSGIWAVPATLATISSYGGAAAAAPGLIAAAQGIVAAQSVFGAGFMEGGYTGDGPRNQVAGVVHRGEWVAPADVVRRVGLTNLEAMRTGAPSNGQSGVNVATGGTTHVHHYWNSEEEMRKHIQSNPHVQHAIISVVGKNMHKLR